MKDFAKRNNEFIKMLQGAQLRLGAMTPVVTHSSFLVGSDKPNQTVSRLTRDQHVVDQPGVYLGMLIPSGS